ncbi:MAG: class I SAM-dependent methyltransferase [Anaerolineales bacterium]|nr:class I SAM-dependent methyltransferase [Anaerolineales bacterium]
MSANTCRLCGAKEPNTTYSGPIRAGGADSGTVDGFSIRGCAACGVEFLDPFPEDTEAYYTGKEYWEDHHGPVNVAKLYAKHGPEQRRWFYEVSGEMLRNQRVVDFGCGAGIFLDMAKGLAAETIGVDLAEHFREHLEANGHKFLRGSDSLAENSVDVVVSFDTLEHVPDPLAFLQEIRRVLKPGGRAFVGLPNQDDFLKTFVPDYIPFFYHLSHLYYFSTRALQFAFEQAGFADIHIGNVHKYDITNMLVWARDRKGIGTPGSDVFDRYTEDTWRGNLERQGIASHLYAVVRK